MASAPVAWPMISQPRLFAWLRRRLFANSLRLMVQRSRLRLALIVGLSLIIWIGLYTLFAEGFQFLRRLETAVPVSYRIVELLFGLFFLSLTALMVFSTGLLLYGSLFRAPESSFLLTTPADADQVFAYKLREALFFSGWAFLLLGTPLLVAYGIEMRAHWPYYVLLGPYLLGFLILPGSLGGLCCLLIVYYLPRRRKQALAAIILLGIAAVVVWGASAAAGARAGSISEAWIRKLIGHLRPAQMPFLPSRWMTTGLMAGATGDFGEGSFYLLVIWSNALFFYLASTYAAARLYRRAFSLVASGGAARRKYGENAFDRLAARLLAWADPRTRLFILKDLRTFRRDPVQWAQVLILGGFLLLYFVNIPRMPHGQYVLYQRTFIGLLNLSVIGLMLATYTSRFIFPMISLEGRNFWILGLLPVERDRLLSSKLAYALVISLTTSLFLALLSELMLGLPWPIVVLHLLTMVVLAVGLSAISVGLGAFLVNLKESNPSKIATGFGGTINLLTSLVYAVLIVALAGVPTYFYFANTDARTQELIELEQIRHWLMLSTSGLLLLGAAATILPMRLGRRAFRRMEF